MMRKFQTSRLQSHSQNSKKASRYHNHNLKSIGELSRTVAFHRNKGILNTYYNEGGDGAADGSNNNGEDENESNMNTEQDKNEISQNNRNEIDNFTKDSASSSSSSSSCGNSPHPNSSPNSSPNNSFVTPTTKS